jgi:hypothetical protein
VRVFTGPNLFQLADYFGIDDPNFRGGARVAVGDITGDGKAEVIVAAGTGGGPRVSAWDGASLGGGRFNAQVASDFFAFEQSLRDGVFLAAGDVDGDGRADLVVGAGPGGAPRVLVVSGRQLVDTNTAVAVADFFAGDTDQRGGVPVGVADLDFDARLDVTAGGGRTSTVRGYFAKNLGSGTPDLTIDPYSGFDGGVFVG